MQKRIGIGQEVKILGQPNPPDHLWFKGGANTSNRALFLAILETFYKKKIIRASFGGLMLFSSVPKLFPE